MWGVKKKDVTWYCDVELAGAGIITGWQVKIG
jgi:hypothetical protein